MACFLMNHFAFCQFKLLFFTIFQNIFLNQIFIFINTNKIFVKIETFVLTLLLRTNLTKNIDCKIIDL